MSGARGESDRCELTWLNPARAFPTAPGLGSSIPTTFALASGAHIPTKHVACECRWAGIASRRWFSVNLRLAAPVPFTWPSRRRLGTVWLFRVWYYLPRVLSTFGRLDDWLLSPSALLAPGMLPPLSLQYISSSFSMPRQLRIYPTIHPLVYSTYHSISAGYV